jgi:peptidoglycan/LPS O-acetylase OafA/YrhL
MKVTYIKPLDGVRAIAALMVLIFHCFQMTTYNSSLGLLLQKIGFLGQTGVSLFFVLSGFLITRILIQQKDEPHFIVNFFIRRALRIFPLYFFYLCLMYFILPTVFEKPSPDFSQQWYYWFYLQDFAITFRWPAIGPKHFWSLAIEEHFYLIWPFVILFNKTKGIILTIVTFIAVSAVTRMLLVQNGYETYFFTFARLDEISLGCLLALIESKGILSKWKPNQIAVLLLVVTCVAGILWFQFTSLANPVIQVIKYQFISVTYFLAVTWVLIAPSQSLITRLLSSQFLVYTGTISYGIYVYQAIAIEITRAFEIQNNALFFLGVAFTCYSIATVSYFLFEKPILNLKSKFIR